MSPGCDERRQHRGGRGDAGSEGQRRAALEPADHLLERRPGRVVEAAVLVLHAGLVAGQVEGAGEHRAGDEGGAGARARRCRDAARAWRRTGEVPEEGPFVSDLWVPIPAVVVPPPQRKPKRAIEGEAAAAPRRRAGAAAPPRRGASARRRDRRRPGSPASCRAEPARRSGCRGRARAAAARDAPHRPPHAPPASGRRAAAGIRRGTGRRRRRSPSAGPRPWSGPTGRRPRRCRSG